MSSTTLWDPYDSPETLLRDELYIQQTDMNGGVDDCGEDHCITGSTNTPRISFHSHSLNQNELKVEQHSKTHSQEKPACTSTVEKTLQRESDLQRLTCSVAPLPQDAYRGIQFRLVRSWLRYLTLETLFSCLPSIFSSLANNSI